MYMYGQILSSQYSLRHQKHLVFLPCMMHFLRLLIEVYWHVVSLFGLYHKSELSFFFHVGFIPKNESVTTCQAQKHWMPDPGNLTCVEAVALIMGGKLGDGRIGEKRLELYGPNESMILPNFVSGSWGQALFYHEGKVIMCGGCSETTSMLCLKGEFQTEKRGSLGISKPLIHKSTFFDLKLL